MYYQLPPDCTFRRLHEIPIDIVNAKCLPPCILLPQRNLLPHNAVFRILLQCILPIQHEMKERNRSKNTEINLIYDSWLSLFFFFFFFFLLLSFCLVLFVFYYSIHMVDFPPFWQRETTCLTSCLLFYMSSPF